MSELNPEQQAPEPEQQQEAQETQQQETWSPSQEEFQSLQQTVQQLTGFAPTLQQLQQMMQEEQQPDPNDLDIDQYIEMKLQERMAPIMPIVSNAAQRAGQERMQTLFSELKQKEKLDFDDKIAERFSHAFFAETGDPVKAVEEGARAAAEFRKQERKAGEDSYKESLRRGPMTQDPGVEGGGNRTIPAAKTYDEVIERYTHTDEV